MHVDSVTIQVPPDNNHEIDETKESRRLPDPEWYWWPATRLLTSSLMAGKIQKVRIGYSGTLKIRAPGEEAWCQHENSLECLEKLDSVQCLRYPRSSEERRRESCERREFMRARNEGQLHKFTSQGALEADMQTRRQRFDFTVAREDDPIGEVGTVLVLTRPTVT